MKMYNIIRIIIVIIASVLIVADYTFSVSRYPDSSIFGYGLLSLLTASAMYNPPNTFTREWYIRWVVCPIVTFVFLFLTLVSTNRA
jgi:hypothetical protein